MASTSVIEKPRRKVPLSMTAKKFFPLGLTQVVDLHAGKPEATPTVTTRLSPKLNVVALPEVVQGGSQTTKHGRMSSNQYPTYFAREPGMINLKARRLDQLNRSWLMDQSRTYTNSYVINKQGQVREYPEESQQQPMLHKELVLSPIANSTVGSTTRISACADSTSSLTRHKTLYEKHKIYQNSPNPSLKSIVPKMKNLRKK